MRLSNKLFRSFYPFSLLLLTNSPLVEPLFNQSLFQTVQIYSTKGSPCGFCLPFLLPINRILFYVSVFSPALLV
uniref:Putative secreted protein n=1 Tax=Anopheles triannulatus TaxID=58253 RepID=A0A2M4B185_9DIPT